MRRKAAVRSAPDAELFDEVRVLVRVGALEIVQELAAVLHLAQKPVAAGMVLLVRLKVLGEGRDLLGENRDLDFA